TEMPKKVQSVAPKPAAPVAQTASVIRQARIEATIGAHVLSDDEKSALTSIGSYAHVAFSGLGRATEGTLNAVGYLSSPFWIRSMMKSSATLTEFLLAFPPIQRQLMRALTYVPGAIKLEQGLQILPQVLVSGMNKLWEYTLQGAMK